jgi:hypothetical protein
MASKAIDMYMEHKLQGTKIDIIILDDPETPAPKIKPTPQVGHTCMIRHQVKRTTSGEVLGLNRADRPSPAIITAVYLDGPGYLVRTGTSDVWEVQPATNNTWETINPLQNRNV